MRGKQFRKVINILTDMWCNKSFIAKKQQVLFRRKKEYWFTVSLFCYFLKLLIIEVSKTKEICNVGNQVLELHFKIFCSRTTGEKINVFKVESNCLFKSIRHARTYAQLCISLKNPCKECYDAKYYLAFVIVNCLFTTWCVSLQK